MFPHLLDQSQLPKDPQSKIENIWKWKKKMEKKYMIPHSLEIDQMNDCKENIVLYLIPFIINKINIIMYCSSY